MIPAPSTITEIDELPGDEYEFGIGDPRWVMRNNAELYSDVTTAIIREYSTNAYDANVMAGHSDPIQVTLPSVMGDHFFVVTDTGVGMNREIFKEVYTQFGISDKRELKDTNGLMGYGSKSGVAYTDQFTVVSVRDGVKSEAVVRRRPDWSIVLKVVREYRTDEPNGTTITIPVHNVEEFNHKAAEYYKYWLPGRVLVNGKEPGHHVGEKVADNLYYSKDWNTSYVVMGNVPYRINNPAALFYNSKMSSMNFVAYVDDIKTIDGAQPVEFTPSREDLKYSERTKATLQEIIHSFERDIVATAKSDIAKATTHAEAYEAWAKWTGSLGRAMFDDLEFKGDKFRPDFNVAAFMYRVSSYRGSSYRVSEWNVESMPTTMVVTEFDVSMSSTVKTRAKEYAKLKGWGSPTYVLFTSWKGDDIKSPWITREKFVTWSDLKAALPKKPKVVNPYSNNPNAGRVSGSWDYYTIKGKEIEQPLPKNAGKVYHISTYQNKSFSVSTVLSYLNDKDAVVLIVPANRLPKLLRENPSVESFTAYARSKVVKDGPSLLSKEGKQVLSLSSDVRRWLNGMDLTRVNDPELHRLAGLIKDENTLLKDYQRNHNLARACKMWYDVKEYQSKTVNNYVFDTYPLLRSHSYYSVHEHLYLYMNAVHAAESE